MWNVIVHPTKLIRKKVSSSPNEKMDEHTQRSNHTVHRGINTKKKKKKKSKNLGQVVKCWQRRNFDKFNKDAISYIPPTHL